MHKAYVLRQLSQVHQPNSLQSQASLTVETLALTCPNIVKPRITKDRKPGATSLTDGPTLSHSTFCAGWVCSHVWILEPLSYGWRDAGRSTPTVTTERQTLSLFLS